MASDSRDDSPTPWSWVDRELHELQDAHLLRVRRRRESPPVQGLVQLDGAQLVNLGSNDYLGLAADTRLVDAVRRFAGYHGWGSGASPLVAGHGTLHAKLEEALADFEGTQSALLFTSGFSANLGVLSALVRPEDQVFSDQLNHASLIDGIRLTRATCSVYRHGDCDELETQLRQASTASRRWIVTDTVFSMDGDGADLVRLVELAEAYDALLLVDEAHATGVFGARGRGWHEHLGVSTERMIVVGTLSKALGASGGFVAAARAVIELIVNRARSYMFSTAVPEASCAAALAALEIVKSEPQRREQLALLASWFREQLAAQGWTRLGQTQIVPLRVGEPAAALQLSAKLLEAGFFVPAIRPPAVPHGESLLRASLTSSHTREQLSKLLQLLAQYRVETS